MRRPRAVPGWERYLPLSGVAFTTVMVAAAVAFPMPPGGDVSPASQPAWLAAHYNAIIAQGYLRGLAAIAFIAFSAAVARAIHRAVPGPSSLPGGALVGGAFTGGMLLLAQAVSLAGALHAHAGGNPDTVRALGTLQDGVLDLSSLPAALMFAAVGVSAWRTRLLPRWLTVLTFLGVPFALIDAAGYHGSPLESAGILGLLYFLAWSLLAGVGLSKSTHADATLPSRRSAGSGMGGAAPASGKTGA